MMWLPPSSVMQDDLHPFLWCQTSSYLCGTSLPLTFRMRLHPPLVKISCFFLWCQIISFLCDVRLSLISMMISSFLCDARLPPSYRTPHSLSPLWCPTLSYLCDDRSFSSFLNDDALFFLPGARLALPSLQHSFLYDVRFPLTSLMTPSFLPSFLPFSMCDAILPLNSEMSKSIIPLWCQTPSFPIDARLFFLNGARLAPPCVWDSLLPQCEMISILCDVQLFLLFLWCHHSSFLDDVWLPLTSLMRLLTSSMISDFLLFLGHQTPWPQNLNTPSIRQEMCKIIHKIINSFCLEL